MTVLEHQSVDTAHKPFDIPHRDWLNHPRPGMKFPDMALAIRDGAMWAKIVKHMAAFVDADTALVAGIDIGGSYLGGAIALTTGRGFMELRKVANMRPELMRILTRNYAVGEGVALARDSIQPGQKVVIVDDCIVSGSVAVASIQLMRREGVVVDTALFAFEITDAGGRAALQAIGVTVHALQGLDSRR